MIIASQHNTPLEDLATANNYARPVIAGGTGSNTPAGAATNLQVLPLAGGTMTGSIDMDGHEIVDPIGIFLSGFIFGLTLTNNVSDPTNDIDIAAGSAASDASIPYVMNLPATLTKRIDAAWAVGSGNGGLDTGAVGNNVYYVWLIQRSDTGVVDALFSLSSTAPTMPANYDRKRLIGSFARTSASNNAPRSYSQKEPTPWVSYTPTLTGVGTPTSVVCRSRRVGSNLEVEASWINGTTTAVDFAMSMGFNGIDGNVVCDAFWNIRRPVVGVAVWQVAGAAALYVLGQGSFNQVNISISSAGRDGFTPVTGATLGNSIPIGVRYSVPIYGWN